MSPYVAALRFDGDPAQLVPAYHRLLEQFPLDALDLHISVTDGAGLTVIDSCPSRQAFEAFRTSREFLGAVAAAGLPTPRADGLGDLLLAHLREPVTA